MRRVVAVAVALALSVGTSADAQTRSPAQWPFAATSPWNMPMGSGAQFLNPGCDLLIRSEATKDGQNGRLMPWINAERYGMPIYRATAADPLETVYRGGTPSSPSPSGTAVDSVRMPDAATPSDGTDRHLAVVQPDGLSSAESWLTYNNAGFVNTGHFVREDLRRNGWAALDGTGSGIRAARASLLGGVLRTHELQAGTVPHALAVALPRALMAARYVSPASNVDGDTTGYNGIIPMGQLLALKPSVSIGSLGLRSAAGRALAKALQDYGAYVVDTGGSTAFYAEPSGRAMVHEARWPDGSGRSDVQRIVEKLSCVTNNAAPSWGGGGTPRAPLAPAFE